jgi:hypothetical protein
MNNHFIQQTTEAPFEAVNAYTPATFEIRLINGCGVMRLAGNFRNIPNK